MDVNKNLTALENFLAPRLAAAQRGDWTEQSVEEIVEEVIREKSAELKPSADFLKVRK